MNSIRAFKLLATGTAACAIVILGLAFNAGAASTDKAQIQALEEQLTAAFAARDVDKIMQCYAPGDDLFVFDTIPPRQYVGAAAFRKDYEDFFATAAAGSLTIQMSDLDITTDGKLAFAHYVSHMVMTDKSGAKLEMVERTTDCLKKIKGKWLIVHEHDSVPVDLATGKADLMSKP
ncbi:YybH family protein [Candidatus Binatus sp.]|uniref:YybH family protein n=1 Tax=Candidatus Binatus sp. TaxID=2811406 RepID=UPI003CC61BF7